MMTEERVAPFERLRYMLRHRVYIVRSTSNCEQSNKCVWATFVLLPTQRIKEYQTKGMSRLLFGGVGAGSD